MMQILVIYNCDNGYSCGCCGQTWQEHEVLKIDGRVNIKDWINSHNKSVADSYAKRKDQYGRNSMDSAFIISERIL